MWFVLSVTPRIDPERDTWIVPCKYLGDRMKEHLEGLTSIEVALRQQVCRKGVEGDEKRAEDTYSWRQVGKSIA